MSLKYKKRQFYRLWTSVILIPPTSCTCLDAFRTALKFLSWVVLDTIHSLNVCCSENGLDDSNHLARQGSPSSCHTRPFFSLNSAWDSIKNKRGWKHYCGAPVLPGEPIVSMEEDTLPPARRVIWLCWACLNLLLFHFLHSLIVPHSAAIWKLRVYLSVLLSRWFTYLSL